MAHDRWPDLKGVHVFVIDDNDDSCRLLEQALNYCGALVTVFSSAEAALEAMKEYIPTLIISDLSMPGMTGLEFMRRVRERPVEKGGLIPAIAVTAYYEDFAAVIARAAGFEAYLTKPIKFVTLCMLVYHVAGIKRERDDNAA
jgi:CheY-like chemotaxis protein